MPTHTSHPDSHKAGLADNCPRCGEHAERPFDSLDDENLYNLVERVNHKEEPRSNNEGLAMKRIRDVMNKASKLESLGFNNRVYP